MNFNQLLRNHRIEPQGVLALRHRPWEPELRKVLLWLAAEKPDVFNAFQRSHGAGLEKAMTKATYVASFIGHQPGKAVFIGLYSIGKWKPLSFRQFWAVPENIELKKHGMQGFTHEDARPSILWFDLRLMDFYKGWKGKLIIDWPGMERAWWRRMERNEFPVHAVLEDSLLDQAMPPWNQIVVKWDHLDLLPTPWKAKLSEWRGIYYIFDQSDSKGYVGSAYGRQNILGRWLNYAASGHGGNRQLRKRDPRNFTFAILERVSPDMAADEVIRIEETWKDRLHTRPPHGLNDN